MSAHPILFTDAMVRAILCGRKTQTRRPIKPSNSLFDGGPFPSCLWDADSGESVPVMAHLDFASAQRDDGPSPAGNPGPYLHVPLRDGDTTHRIYPRVQPGDVLWVREAWRAANSGEGVVYRADGAVARSWKQAMFMPRAMSRITLAVESVRAERVQDITEDDARAEGVDGGCLTCGEKRLDGGCGCGDPLPDYIDGFAAIWLEIYGDKPGLRWDANPWVWVYEFRMVAQDITLRDQRDVGAVAMTQCYHCGDRGAPMDENHYMLCVECAKEFDLCPRCAATKPRGQFCRCEIQVIDVGAFVDPMDKFREWLGSLGPVTLERLP